MSVTLETGQRRSTSLHGRGRVKQCSALGPAGSGSVPCKLKFPSRKCCLLVTFCRSFRNNLGIAGGLQRLGVLPGLVYPSLLLSLGMFLLGAGGGRVICTHFGFAAAAGGGEDSGSPDEAAAGRAGAVPRLRGNDPAAGAGEGAPEDSTGIWKARATVYGWTPHPWRGKAPNRFNPKGCSLSSSPSESISRDCPIQTSCCGQIFEAQCFGEHREQLVPLGASLLPCWG